MVPTPIYHITHIDNLPRIIETQRLWCDTERVRQGVEAMGIAHRNIKDRRSRKPVFVAAGGTLADYVPFYFSNRSPMLYSIHSGCVEGYSGGERDIVYLTSTAEGVARGDRPWCFTDGHAAMQISRFFETLDDLEQIDWEVIRSPSWGSRDNDPDRKRRKQAEFLVHHSFPWHWTESIGVIDEATAGRVQDILAGSNHRPGIRIERDWYY